MESEVLYDTVWVKRGKQKRAVMMVMEKPMFPSEIQKKAKTINPKLSLNNTSDIVRSFTEHGLAHCLNPKEKIGRLYELTKKGKRVRKEIVGWI